MTRSRLNTIRPQCQAADRRRGRTLLRYAPLASAISAILAGVPAAYAADPEGGLDEIVVTAQKKTENLQDVPISIEVLDSEKLEKLHIANLDDYVKYSPSIAYVRGEGQGGNGQPGSSHIYMRGVVSGGTNHSGSQPSVGSYLDEQPVTTIDGTVDVHIYDIQRIEVLEGPQGTLYGASSEAGTVRIISNKPDPSKFEAGYQVGGDHVQHGGFGYEVDGFVNLPLSPVLAVRLVGWREHDAGFIDNVAGTNAAAGIVDGVRTFPTWSSIPGNDGSIGKGSISNAAYVKNNYNSVDTTGGRAALKLDLGDWTVTPTAMGQRVTSEGFFGYDPVVGDLQVAHFGPEFSDDSWMQSALTVEGKVSNFDIVYAGAYMKRDTHSVADYSDYSYFYDKAFGSGAIWRGSDGLPIMPQELVVSKGIFEKFSHELRVSTPQELPVRATAGVFVQRQAHHIYEDYVMPGYNFTNYLGGNANGFDPALSIPGHPNTIWLTDETRVDRDKAIFAQVTGDITSQLALSVGERYFKSDNTLEGFFGYSKAYQSLSGYGSGESKCFAPPNTIGAPCQNLGNRDTETGHVPKVNLSYKIDKNLMVYATFSKGFRPGGVNRTAQVGIGPYQADYLTNYEVGWKTQWFNHHVRWNGAIFQEDWKNFQFSFLGPNSVTIIENGGDARIRGMENEIEFAATSNLTLTSSFTFLDPRLTSDYCGEDDPATGRPARSNPCPAGSGGATPYPPQAPSGTNLPTSPKFKGNVVARYALNPIDGWEPNVQAAFVYQTQVSPALKTQDTQLIGKQPAYGMVDLSTGVEKNGMNFQLILDNVTDKRAQLSRFEQCTVAVCTQPYIIPTQPRTIGIKFGQKF